MTKKINYWDERSDLVREILGKPPSWVIRYGITIIFVIISLLLLGASLLSYNDIIPVRILVTSKNPPVHLQSYTSGKLTSVFIEQGQLVDIGDILLELENTASIDDMYYLKSKLKDNELALVPLDSLNSLFPLFLDLGHVQPAYGNFRVHYQNYILFNSTASKKRSSLVLKNPLQSQNPGLSSSPTQKSSNFLNSSGIQEKIREDNYRGQLVQAYLHLQDEIQQWEQNYILKSPIKGKVTIFDAIKEHQYVTAGETIFTIIPNDLEEIIGQASLPIQNSSKVKVGQKVIIKLENYPFHEWGSLQGTVSRISEVPKHEQEAFYLLDVKIKNLTTSFDKKIDFKQEMRGNAEIVTEELSVLERIFYQLKKTFSG
ncbi:HlyD family efflux transporter periplasmic adaptor subunit [Ulvibacterium sp.]|uniref:HlyD family efflux transporter periplasmic adaptor subunit n=1 Tax=Ulvibacterium sp. TaxID=2665914 RepID=UPI003BAD74EE